MKDFIKRNTIQIAVIAPIVTSILGLLIINLYLAQYDLVDYSIFRARSIYVGIMFLVFLSGILLYFSMFVDMKNPEKNNFGILTAQIAIKAILLSTLLFLLLTNPLRQKALIFNIMPYNLSSYILFIFVLTALSSIYLHYNTITRKLRTWVRTTLIAFIFVGFIMNLAIYINLLFIDDMFRGVAYFVFISAFLFYLPFFIIWLSETSKKKVSGMSLGFLFTREQKSEPLNVEIAIIVFTTIIFFIYAMVVYSFDMYPNIPKVVGGGATKEITVRRGNKEIKGKMIHSNENIIYLLDKNERIKILKWSEVVEIGSSPNDSIQP